jgi:hypothetical protein
MTTIASVKYPGIVNSGLLAIFLCTPTPVPDSIRNRYERLYSMVDWYSESREIASIHSDQSLSPKVTSSDFTEIVVLETAVQRNYLVVLNGLESQGPNRIRLEVRNHKGESRTAFYPEAMVPFSVHRLNLRELFPDLVAFSDGQHVTLSGHSECRGVYIRPYVVTEGQTFNVYHGGDKYTWPGIPDLIYNYLGRGEVNPMVALHQDTLTTAVNLLNSHGDLEEDFWVDARLYNQKGSLVVSRERWMLAQRNHMARGEISTLLPDPKMPFAGHIALSFSPDAKVLYPRRLQALLEYHTPMSAARVMAWSDVWNGRHKVRELKQKLGPLKLVENIFSRRYYRDEIGTTYHCHYRVWFKPPIMSYIAVTNCGIEQDYSKRATYVLTLHNTLGESLGYRGEIAANGTDYGRIDEFFGRAAEFAGSDGVMIATIDSPNDLAVMHLTGHERSGVYSAEHFLASGSYDDGQYDLMCGS